MKIIVITTEGREKKDIQGDADTVDALHASATPEANKLLAMNANAKLPAHTVAGALTVEGALKLHGNFETFQGYKQLQDNVATTIFKIEFAATTFEASLILDLVLGSTIGGYVSVLERWALAFRLYSDIASAAGLIVRVDAGSQNPTYADLGNAVVTIADDLGNKRFTISVQVDQTGTTEGLPRCTYMAQLLFSGPVPTFTAL